MPETPVGENEKDQKLQELEGNDLETVAGGKPTSADYAALMQMMSTLLRKLEDTQKQVVNNIR